VTEPTGPVRGIGQRLFVSWLIVLIPIAYGTYMTVKSIYPLFG
jgi:hypothetical protein